MIFAKMEEIMKRKTQIVLCLTLLVLGLISFILQIFVFSAPDGVLGFLLCLFSIYLMMGSIFKLCKLSERFKNTLLDTLDLLFFIG